MSVGRGWKITSWNVRNRAILWIFFGILLVQGTFGESTNNATDTSEADSDDVEVVSLVKKDKRQAQRGYTDVPLDQGPFDELIASSPAPIAFENDLPTFVDSLSDIADATPPDYNTNKFPNYGPPPDRRNNNGNSKDLPGEGRERPLSFSPSPSTPGPSAAPSSPRAVVVASNGLGPLSNVSKPLSFFGQNQIPVALNNGVPYGPVSSGVGLSGPGITPTGRLTDSLALPDNIAAAALNIERRQAELPVTPNEPPPFNGKAIPGEAGLDYPIFGEIPRTSFSCKDQAWPGYYADTQARCQVFWICQKHRMDGFLCPNGTLFNQQVFVCDWWFNVDCSAAPEFYSRNQFVYAGPGIGIDGQPVRGLSFPLSASNRVANVLPPLPPQIRNNALLAAPSGQGSQVQSSNQVARVAPVTARPPDFQSRADSLNNFLKSAQTTGSGQSYQSQLVSRLQSNPNRLHDTVSIVKSTGSPPLIPSKDKDRRLPAASSQITQSHVSGTSRPTIVSSYQPQHVETVSIVTTANPTTRSTTPRPPPPPIPKFTVTPKPIKGPSPSPFGNVIKLGTTVTISTTHRPDFSTKQSLFKGIISSTVKPSKSGILKLSNSHLLGSNSQTNLKAVSLNRPSPTPSFHSRPPSTEDPNNTVRPPDYSPQRAPDPTPPPFSAPGYLPSSRPHSYVDSSGFGRESKQQHQFAASNNKPLTGHGMRSNQFSNVHGQRENIYASSRKDTFIEFPYSPSQQKHKQKLAELATSKDISSAKAVVTAIPHFYGQRSNVYSGTESLSYISNNNKRVIIDHTNYASASQRQGPFAKSAHGKVQHQNIFPHTAPAGHHGPSQPPPQQSQHFIQHTTAKPRPPPQQYLENTGPSPSRPTPSLIPPTQQQHHIQSSQLQVSSKPEQRFVTYAPSPSPQHIQSSTAQYHHALPQSTPTFPPGPQNHHGFPQSTPFPPGAQNHHPFPQSTPFPPGPQNHHAFPQSTPFPLGAQNHHAFPQSTPFPPGAQNHHAFPQSSPFPPGAQHHHQLPPSLSRSDAVTPRDGFTPLNAGSFVSIQTTAPPFSQQILKHNSLQPYQEGHRGGGTVVQYSSTGPPPTPQQVIFSSPPTNNNPLGSFVSSTAAPRAFDHAPPPQHGFIPAQQQSHLNLNPSTPPPYYEHQGTPTPKPQAPTPYSTPNNFIAAPTQSPFLTTSPGHRQNPYLPHNHGKQKNKQQHRPPSPPPPSPSPSSPSLSAANPVSFPHGGITTTIKYPEGTGKLRLDFSGGGANRKNIVDFTYSASPTTPSNYISSTSTPYPQSKDRFTQAVSSTTVRPSQQLSFPPPGSSGRGPGGRYAGAVTNKSNLSSSAIYVDTAAAAESVSTPVTVPSPSATTPSSSSLPPVSTSNYGLRLSATAKKRMTGAWQSYFSSKSE